VLIYAVLKKYEYKSFFDKLHDMMKDFFKLRLTQWKIPTSENVAISVYFLRFFPLASLAHFANF
jgi:hypothetical protein